MMLGKISFFFFFVFPWELDRVKHMETTYLVPGVFTDLVKDLHAVWYLEFGSVVRLY